MLMPVPEGWRQRRFGPHRQECRLPFGAARTAHRNFEKGHAMVRVAEGERPLSWFPTVIRFAEPANGDGLLHATEIVLYSKCCFAANPPLFSRKSTTTSTPSPVFRLVNTKGRSFRILDRKSVV